MSTIESSTARAITRHVRLVDEWRADLDAALALHGPACVRAVRAVLWLATSTEIALIRAGAGAIRGRSLRDASMIRRALRVNDASA